MLGLEGREMERDMIMAVRLRLCGMGGDGQETDTAGAAMGFFSFSFVSD